MNSYKGAKKLGIAALVLDIIALTYYFSTTIIGVSYYWLCISWIIDY
jgi:hypothetical protein